MKYPTLRPNGKTYQPSWQTSEGGNPLTKYVNLCQTKEERRDKYAFCRFFGIKPSIAQHLRDWHWTKIQLYIEALNRQLELPMTSQPQAR